MERRRRDWRLALRVPPADSGAAIAAGAIAWRHALRGFGAVHLASALAACTLLGSGITMVTYGRDLWSAATADGLAALPRSP